MGPMFEVLNNRTDQSTVHGCKRELKLRAAHILIASSVGLYKPYYLLTLSVFCLKTTRNESLPHS